MVDALALGSVALVALSAVLLVLLVVRRVALARHERRWRVAEERLRPLALALVEGEAVDPPALAERDAVVFAELLSRYARRLRGSAAERIASYFERNGSVEREIEALGHRSSWRRARAAHALGDMSSGTAGSALLEALDDPERDVRAAAARSLGRLGAVEAVGPLVEALAAGRVPPAVAGFALVQLGPAAIPRLDPLLSHDEPVVRARAAELIGLVGDASDSDHLLASLRDPSAEVRASSARALGRLGADEAASGLRAALGDRVPFVRTAAARALGSIRDDDAFEALLEQARTDTSRSICCSPAWPGAA